MENRMKDYLGNEYSNNHVRNFCLYWMKGSDTMPVWEDTEAGRARYDAWRKENDLDCMYLDGDMKADTLFSAWTPIKWVADCLNSKNDMRFYKRTRDEQDPYRHLNLLADDRDTYLPPGHELVLLLDRFLELAEGRWNYILLPDRQMNCLRYNGLSIGETSVTLFDEVPAMLYHIYQKDSLGRFFLDENGEVDQKKVEAWIHRERLEMGFDGEVKPDRILPFISGLQTGEAKWLSDENEIKEALIYMTTFLERRKRRFV